MPGAHRCERELKEKRTVRKPAGPFLSQSWDGERNVRNMSLGEKQTLQVCAFQNGGLTTLQHCTVPAPVTSRPWDVIPWDGQRSGGTEAKKSS